MSDQPILWGRGSSTNVQKVLWTCHELGIDVDHRRLAGEYGGNDAAWFLELNPNGTVPVWQDGDFSLYESQAIMRHIAREKGRLYGSSPQGTARVDCWLDWFALVFWPPVRMLFLDVYRDAKLAPDAPQARQAHARATQLSAAIAARLEHSAFVGGPEFSIADIAVTIGLNRMVGLDFGIAVPRRLSNWLDIQRARPGFVFATQDEPDMPGHRHQGAA